LNRLSLQKIQYFVGIEFGYRTHQNKNIQTLSTKSRQVGANLYVWVISFFVINPEIMFELFELIFYIEKI